jgi:chorismate synthase
MLKTALGIDIVAWVSQVGQIKAPETEGLNLTRAMVDASMIRCPDTDTAKAMEALVLKAKEEKDSIGGVVSCVCTNVPAGLGEPVFDKLEALLAHAMLSIPATKGFEIGSGFAGAQMRGSVHNDPFVVKDGRLGTTTNFSGGIQGGISNGEPIMFRVAFKPPATIGLAQETVDFQGRQATLAAKGRHDPCVAARAVPIVESMAALVLADVMLQQQARLAGMALMNQPQL